MRSKHRLIMDSSSDPVARTLLDLDPSPWYIPDETRLFLIEQCAGVCAICHEKTMFLHIDHIYPVDLGGKCFLDNLQVLCRTCNLRKSNHVLDPQSYVTGHVIPIIVEKERSISSRILDKVWDERK